MTRLLLVIFAAACGAFSLYLLAAMAWERWNNRRAKRIWREEMNRLHGHPLPHEEVG